MLGQFGNIAIAVNDIEAAIERYEHPGALGTGRVYGGSGRFEGLVSEAVETLSAKAYSAETGPVAMEGHLTIELSVGADDMAELERAANANRQ